MTEAPKKIWAAPDSEKGWAEANAGDWPSPLNPGDTPYIRADHVDDLLKQAREDALREAADQAASVRWSDEACGKTCGMCEQAIRALIAYRESDT